MARLGRSYPISRVIHPFKLPKQAVAGEAVATATAYGATVSIGAPAGLATVSAVANAPNPSVSPFAALVQAAAAALGAQGSTATASGEAVPTASAFAARIAIGPNALEAFAVAHGMQPKAIVPPPFPAPERSAYVPFEQRTLNADPDIRTVPVPFEQRTLYASEG